MNYRLNHDEIIDAIKMALDNSEVVVLKADSAEDTSMADREAFLANAISKRADSYHLYTLEPHDLHKPILPEPQNYITGKKLSRKKRK